MNQRAFTIIEMMVVLAILAITGIIFATTYIAGSNAGDASVALAELQSYGRLAMDKMCDELKNATRTSSSAPSPNIAIPPAPNNNEICFYLPTDADGNGSIIDSSGQIEWDTSNQICYKYVSGDSSLVRVDGSGSRVITHDVVDIQFADIGIDPLLGIRELKIYLMLTRTTPRDLTVSTSLTGYVRLRN